MKGDVTIPMMLLTKLVKALEAQTEILEEIRDRLPAK